MCEIIGDDPHPGLGYQSPATRMTENLCSFVIQMTASGVYLCDSLKVELAGGGESGGGDSSSSGDEDQGCNSLNLKL